MLETLALIMFIISLLLFWILASWLVWHFPGYRTFRQSVERIEKVHVQNVRAAQFARPITMKSLGERRVSELIDTSLGDEFEMRLVRCFGAMFLKDEAISDSIGRLQISCGIAFAALIGGAVWFSVTDLPFQAELAMSDVWELLPRLWEKLRSAELVMYAELLTAGAALVTIIDSGLLLRRLNKETAL